MFPTVCDSQSQQGIHSNKFSLSLGWYRWLLQVQLCDVSHCFNQMPQDALQQKNATQEGIAPGENWGPPAPAPDDARCQASQLIAGDEHGQAEKRRPGASGQGRRGVAPFIPAAPSSFFSGRGLRVRRFFFGGGVSTLALETWLKLRDLPHMAQPTALFPEPRFLVSRGGGAS